MSRRTDLVHVHFSQWGSTFRKLAMCAACIALRKPFVLHANGSRFHLFFHRLPEAARSVIRSVFGQCAAFVAVSQDWGEFYAREFGLRAGQVFVLHNPVQMPAEAPVRRGGTNVLFVSFGRIGQRKGQFDVIRALAAMPLDIRRRCRVLFAGDGEANEARRLADELGVAAQVEVHGWLDAAQRDELLAQADAFVLPSYNEGQPMALLEAMAWGLPPVSTPVGGIPEVVKSGDNGLLVTPGDIAALSGAMRQLIEDEPLRLRMGLRARQRVEPLRVEHFMDRLREIYDKAIEAASASPGGAMMRDPSGDPISTKSVDLGPGD
jgi:glycosyltransferase involved in cell wall biosynthesis